MKGRSGDRGSWFGLASPRNDLIVGQTLESLTTQSMERQKSRGDPADT
jgi:hypothetical protein